MTGMLSGIPDLELVALNVYMEARGEPTDGKCAVARVMLNRTNLPYCSDGTIYGTLMHKNAFSWVAWDYVNGKYQPAYTTPEAQEGHILVCYTMAQKNIAWAACKSAAQAVMNGTYHSAAYDRLTDDVVLYYAPSMVHAPAWAGTDNLVA